MSQLGHKIYISTLIAIVLLVTGYLCYRGFSYYSTGIEERFYHPDYNTFKASGVVGHGLGIIGTLLILIGVFSYIARKRYKFLARFGRLKYWLEFHIFLCSLGPIMILFHTTFKFGGIVSISFWSMVAVVASGVIGRFIYIQIPRTIEGRELSLNEVKQMKGDVGEILRTSYAIDEKSINTILDSTKEAGSQRGGNLFTRMVSGYTANKRTLRKVKKILRSNQMSGKEMRKVIKVVANEMSLNSRIARLQTMQQLFKYWHVAHLPFAIIMLIIMVIHVVVTVTFGATWIF